MHTQKIWFENASGQRLAALIDRPVDDAPIATAVFAHCFTCSKSYKAVAYISRALAAEGIAVLRFDFTGLGESEGDFADTSFSSNVDDLVAAAEEMERLTEAPKVLIGHSLGGAAVLHAAHRIPSVTAVVTIAAPASPRQLLRHLEGKMAQIETEGEAEVNIGGRPFRIKKQFIDDLEEGTMKRTIADLDRALMVFHSPADTVLGIDNAARIFREARHPKSFVSLDQADHMLSNPGDARYAAAVIAGWARKYIGATQEERKRARPGDNRVVARTEAGSYRTSVLANGHPIVADEPEAVGGDNSGPTPYELLGAALAACTTMTLRMYADRKGWSLGAAEARLRHAKVHCEDCTGSERPGSKIDRFERELVLEGALDAAQRQRLLEIADRCPVHRTLGSRTRISTTLAD